MKKFSRLLSVVIVLMLSLTVILAACDKIPDKDGYTRNNYVSVTPSTWNELDSTDANNDAIMGYIGSPFFEYDFQFEGGKFKADGSINAEGIVEGAFDVKYSAATALEDVTSQYGANWDLTADQISEGGYIWKITLRNDLTWDDGTPIKAEDFVYTMQQQLDPLFNNGRSDSYYANAVKIRNAKDYLYQGRQGWFAADTPIAAYDESLAEQLIFRIGPKAADDAPAKDKVQASLRAGNQDGLEELGLNTTQSAGEFLTTFATLVGAPLPEEVTADAINALEGKTVAAIKADATLNATLNKILEWWEEGDDGVLAFTVINYTFPKVDFDKVGIFAPSDYDIVLVVDNPLTFFKEDGVTLSYLAAYQFSNLPLVKKALYEKCKVEPVDKNGVWTSTYCTSVDTSASWGPYKLTSFQAGKQFVLERNDKWYGYKLEDNKGQYQTDKIVTEVIAKEESQQTAFWAGEVDSLGISVTIANDYKNSEYAMYSPRTAIFGIQVYSNLDVLKTNDRNNGLLAIKEFREAMSWSLDRRAYASELSTANQPALGLLSEDYYHDVENGGIYRNTPQAKKALLRAYGYTELDGGKWSDGSKTYNTIDEAVESMTGVNMVLAKQKVNEAWAKLDADHDKYGYDPTKKIQICYGDADDSELSNRYYNFIKNWLEKLVEGTDLEGKIEITKDFTLGNQWDKKFKNGEYDLSTSGVGNAPFDPFYFIGAQINMASSVSYHTYWDTAKDMITFKLPEGTWDKDAGKEITMSLADWYNCLNGNMSSVTAANASRNWSAAPVEVRLEILAMLEQHGLEQYYTLPTVRGFTASLRSAKAHYITDVENVMLGFGGLRYLTYDYNNGEWAEFVKQHNGDLRDFYKG